MVAIITINTTIGVGILAGFIPSFISLSMGHLRNARMTGIRKLATGNNIRNPKAG